MEKEMEQNKLIPIKGIDETRRKYLNEMGINDTSDLMLCGRTRLQREKIAEKIMYKENVPYDQSCAETMEGMIEDGCQVIICNSFDYGDWIVQVAEKHPDVVFLHATGTEIGDNITTYFGRIYQMRYLSGIVAGMQTETDHIGYVAAFPISEVNRGINAFTIGVKSVNPDATVHVIWSESWTDYDLNKLFQY